MIPFGKQQEIWARSFDVKSEKSCQETASPQSLESEFHKYISPRVPRKSGVFLRDNLKALRFV